MLYAFAGIPHLKENCDNGIYWGFRGLVLMVNPRRGSCLVVNPMNQSHLKHMTTMIVEVKGKVVRDCFIRPAMMSGRAGQEYFVLKYICT